MLCKLDREPEPTSWCNVKFDVNVEDVTFAIWVDWDKAFLSQDPGTDAGNQALRWLGDYLRRHVLQLRRLLSQARTLYEATGTIERGPIPAATLTVGPKLVDHTCLCFTIEVDGTPADCFLFKDLGWHCDALEGLAWGSAWNCAIAYLEAHADEVRVLGFDTSSLDEELSELGLVDDDALSRLRLVARPAPTENAEVLFLFESDGLKVTLLLSQARSIRFSEALTESELARKVIATAMLRTGRFERRHRAACHCLLRDAAELARANGATLPVAQVVGEPIRVDQGRLAFFVDVGDKQVHLVVEPALTFRGGSYAALDAALAYMLANRVTIAALGFDVSVLDDANALSGPDDSG